MGGEGFAFGAEEADGMEEEENCGSEDGVEGEESGEEGCEAGEVDLWVNVVSILVCIEAKTMRPECLCGVWFSWRYFERL